MALRLDEICTTVRYVRVSPSFWGVFHMKITFSQNIIALPLIIGNMFYKYLR